ncbi:MULTISPECIES: non-ribosomal peptide synthetase [Photorhabdus]|uniref:Carrier domain-containing protein n=2 Tax=Photorhabdus asymbiotica TaxID=291112 RepID=C7BRM8_PHOAA|nr:non-ribosomal peptide synthetase [Photorhabdus asymbiotica]RKS66623.1 amino acid adenylation domain-containing protein [Photorhabdus asymbiotica]CAQ83429.1 putative protein involved in amino acid adenylation [Photorhabdus asymbiotica]
MSIFGLIKLMELAKAGVRFEQLSPQHRVICSAAIKNINTDDPDIVDFIAGCRHETQLDNTAIKERYDIDRYAGQYLWLYENLTKGSAMYNIPIAKEIIGDFDPIRLISALKKLISCHEILRGIYKMDDDTISIEFREPDAEVYNSCYQDISHLPIEEQEQIIAETLAGQCTQPFNLASELPIRCHILKTNKFCHYLFLTFHHCIVDGWTANILVNELNHNYRGDDSICSRSDRKFFQFLEDPFINVSDVDHSLKFWRDELHGAPERHKLPYDITINYDELKTNIIRNSLPCRLTRDLIKTSNREGTSLFTLLHTAFAVLIAKKSESERVVIGSPVANRNIQELNSVPGSFVNTVAYQFQIREEYTFAVLLKETANKFAEAYRHQGLPFAYLIEKLQPIRGHFHPIFQIMFVCQHRKSNEFVFGSAQIKTLPRHYAPPKFDLVLEIISTEEGIHLEWQYNSNLFNINTIRALSGAYLILLEQIAHNDMLTLNNYDLNTSSDMEELRRLSKGLDIPSFLQQTLPSRLWREMNNNPTLPALIEGDNVLNYAQLIEKAGTIARWLNNNIHTNDIIAVDISRGALQAIAMLGIVLSGRTYLPLPAGLPLKRIASILELSNSQIILSTEQSSCTQAIRGTRRVILNDNFFTAAKSAVDFVPINCQPQDLAYIIYTSGTTGKPKGVAIEHASVTNTLLSMNHLFAITSRDNVLSIADVGFDLSVYDLFGSWLAGATVVCMHEDDIREPSIWLELIQKHYITVWNSVPAVLQLLVSYCEQENISELPSLRHIWLSGDWISTRLVNQAHKLFPNAMITSLGGATEASIWSVYYSLENSISYRQCIPYGVALPNQSMFVLDENYELCGYGKTGDIYIGGAGVARKYWRDHENTTSSFFFHSELGCRLYRTGDRGRWNRSGYIEFLGREDYQVKLQGFRIEINEVETALKSSGLIGDVRVICCNKESMFEERYLEAYITLSDVCLDLVESTESQLRAHLSTLLPVYMHPTKYHFIERFPLSRNGKLDLSQLISTTAIALQRKVSTELYETTEMGTLKTLLAETLTCDEQDITLHASFFQLGGSSLSGITLLGKLKKVFNTNLTLMDILECKKLIDITYRITQKKSTFLPLTSLSGSDDKAGSPTLYLVHAAGGHLQYYSFLISQLKDYANIKFISSPWLASDTVTSDKTSLYQLAMSHVDTLLQRSATKSNMLIGWSLGGRLAMHMAAIAADKGFPFAHVGVIDMSLSAQQTKTISIKKCYNNICDSFGIDRSKLKYSQHHESGEDFLAEAKHTYMLNKDIMSNKVSLEQTLTFCRAIEKSHGLINADTHMPIIDSPLSIWLTKKRMSRFQSLTSLWQAQSTQAVNISYVDENHYSILNNVQIVDECKIILQKLKEIYIPDLKH